VQHDSLGGLGGDRDRGMGSLGDWVGGVACVEGGTCLYEESCLQKTQVCAHVLMAGCGLTGE
jgi:hypothetical protein